MQLASVKEIDQSRKHLVKHILTGKVRSKFIEVINVIFIRDSREESRGREQGIRKLSILQRPNVAQKHFGFNRR